MSRSFDLIAEYPASVEAVHRAFGDQRYWLARLAGSGADVATLDHLNVDPGGSVDVSTTQALSLEQLPALITQFHRGALEMVRTELWSPLRDGRAVARVRGRVRAAPASLSGDAVLSPTGTGCRLSCVAKVRVDIPLIGGKLESIIGAKLAELMSIEQRFTSTWLGHPA